MTYRKADRLDYARICTASLNNLFNEKCFQNKLMQLAFPNQQIAVFFRPFSAMGASQCAGLCCMAVLPELNE